MLWRLITTTNDQVYLDFANQLADEAGRRLVGWFGRARAETKWDGTIVTEADLDVDGYVQTAVQARFPDHDIMSEEASLIYHGTEYTWVIDPLDGTTNFSDGLPIWGISIALLHQGRPALALLDFPLLNQRYTALRQQGAWLNGRRLRVNPAGALHKNQLIATDSRAGRYLEIRLPPKSRILGSAAYELAAVAAGAVIASLQIRPKVWDVAAAWLIGQEAGATVATWLDGPVLFPLQPGSDYKDRDFPTLFAADSLLWGQIKTASHLRPGAEHVVRRLEAQGWACNFN